MVKLAKSGLKMNIFEETHPARVDVGNRVLPTDLSMMEAFYQHCSQTTTSYTCNKHVEGG